LTPVYGDAADRASTHATRTASTHARVSTGNEHALDGGGHADDAFASGDAAASLRRLFRGGVFFAGVVFGRLDGGGEWNLADVRGVVFAIVIVVRTPGDGVDERDGDA